MIEIRNFRETRFSLADLPPGTDFWKLSSPFKFKISGLSMWPTLQRGDEIEIGPLDSLETGDLVVFRSWEGLVCHRLKEFRSLNDITLQGDASSVPDRGIGFDRILGKVTWIRRGKRKWVPEKEPSPPQGGLNFLKRRWILFREHSKEKTRVGLARLFEAFKKRSVCRRFFSSFIRSHISFYIGLASPLRFVEGYEFYPIEDSTSKPPFLNLSSEWILVGRWKNRRLGYLDPRSGQIYLRNSIQGLGLEADFLRVEKRVRSCLKKQSK